MLCVCIWCKFAATSDLPQKEVFARGRSCPKYLVHGDRIWVDEQGKWFRHFLQWIPPSHPVLLIQDGLIFLRICNGYNDVHLLYLPAHTTHILQPLDIGVFKSFKSFFSRACHKYIVSNPGHVITPDVLTALVGGAWPHSFTLENVVFSLLIQEKLLTGNSLLQKHWSDLLNESKESPLHMTSCRCMRRGTDPECLAWLKCIIQVQCVVLHWDQSLLACQNLYPTNLP